MTFLSMEFEIPLISFIFILFLMISFYSKERINFVENKTYEVILITSLISSLLDTIVHVMSAVTTYDVLSTKYYIIVDYINKFVGTSFVVVFSCLLSYVLLISYKKLRDNPKKTWRFIIIISVLFFCYTNFTHVIITESAFARNTTGPTITGAYFIVGIEIFLAMIISIKNFKKNDKRYYTIFFITSMLIILYILSVLFRGLIIYDLILALLCYIMYFTIENPDSRMITTLLRNKELVEETVNDKSNFLFKVSQDMKRPVKSIIDNAKLYKDTKDQSTKDKIVSRIEQDANNAYFIMNDIANVSSMDVKKLNVCEEKYLSSKLFTDIKVTAKNKISNSGKDIDFKFELFNKCPEYLYGDYVKLKQILLSIISNGISHTDKGFIDVQIDSIVRYDVCRLIFTIKDSGVGMSVEKVNELLSDASDLDIEEFSDNDNLNLKIPIIIKILKLLGGSISIKSEEGKGTSIVVVIDQRVEASLESKVMDSAKKYMPLNKTKKRVFIAYDDEDILAKIVRTVSKYDVDIISSLIGNDILGKIRTGDEFDLIILKDEMSPDSAYSIYKKLKSFKKFNVPVVIIINKDKNFIKEHFIKDGFSDVIILDSFDSDIKRIYDKYL